MAPASPISLAPPTASHALGGVQAFALGVLRNTVEAVVERLLIDAIPLPRTRQFAQTLSDLRAVYDEHASLSFKLARIAQVLGALRQDLEAPDKQTARYGSPTGPMLRACVTLRTYLCVVLPVIESLSAEWTAIDGSARTTLTAPIMPARLTLTVLARIRDMLLAPELSDMMTRPELASLSDRVDTLHAVFEQNAFFRLGPPRSSG